MKLFRKTRKRISRIVGFEEIKGHAVFIKKFTQSALKMGQSENPQNNPENNSENKTPLNPSEKFNEMGMTEKQIRNISLTFKKYFVMYLIVFILAVLYVCHIFISGSIEMGLVGLCFLCFCLVQVFRYHFWLFQIKQRKLGCTFKEWLTHTFSRRPIGASKGGK